MPPTSSTAEYLGGNRLAVQHEGTRLELVVTKFAGYQNRLARDVAGFLRGEITVAMGEDDDKLPGHFKLAVLLPLGIILLIQGMLGVLLIFGISSACLNVVQKEEWFIDTRMAVTLGMAFAGYAVAIAFIIAVLGTHR